MSVRNVVVSAGLLLAVGTIVARGFKPIGDSGEDFFPDENNRARFELRSVGALIERYELQNGFLPATLEELASDTMLNIDGSKITRDPWGREIRYTTSNGDYQLISSGEDGRLGTFDDVSVRRMNSDSVPR